jgi:hypothetical protein
MNFKPSVLRAISGLLCFSIIVSQFAVISSFFKVQKVESKTEQTHIEQFKPQAVAPNYDFSFEAIIPDFTSYVITVFYIETSDSKSVLPSFINTYLANLFEHHIAINAP